MGNFNKKAIEVFGGCNVDMHEDSSTGYFDARLRRLFTYLDMDVVKSWIIPTLQVAKRTDLSILDVGAGKGRMTNCLNKVASHVVAIEPFWGFYEHLAERFASFKNIETRNCTLAEYSRICRKQFDIIYISGVTPYMGDNEIGEFLHHVHKLLAPWGLVCIRELGSERGEIRSSHEINRPRQTIFRLAEKEKLRCIGWQRAYPAVIFSRMYHKWPNKLTSIIWNVASSHFIFPFWKIMANLNLPHFQQKCYFVYLFKTRSEPIA